MDKDNVMKQIALARKQVKSTAKDFGRDSTQYKQAIKNQADLVLKQMTRNFPAPKK